MSFGQVIPDDAVGIGAYAVGVSLSVHSQGVAIQFLVDFISPSGCQHILFECGEHHLLSVVVDDSRVNPVAVVIVLSIARISHDEINLFGSGDVHLHVYALLLAAERHYAAVGHSSIHVACRAPCGVACKDHKLYGAGGTVLQPSRVIDAAESLEFHCVCRQIEEHHGIGICREARGICLAIDLHIAVVVYIAIPSHHVVIRVGESFGHIALFEGIFCAIGQHHSGVYPVAMVVVVAVARVVDHESQLCDAFGQVHLHLLSESVGEQRDGLCGEEGLIEPYPTAAAAQVEQSRISRAAVGVVGCPESGGAVVVYLPVGDAVLVDIYHVAVGDERVGPAVVVGEVAGEEQWRLEDAPQCHHRLLLVV